MFRYSHNSPITRHNNVHYPLQDVIRDKSWQKKKIKEKENKEKVTVPKNKFETLFLKIVKHKKE